MAFVTGEDMQGPLEIIFFPDCYDKYRSDLAEDVKCLIKGHASVDDEKDATFIADDLIKFTDIPQEVWVRFADMDAYKAAEPRMEKMFGLANEGHDRCIIYISKTKQMKGLQRTFEATGLVIDQLMKLAGEENVSVTGGHI
jgi:DNA polymerase-3 subunit alpha